MGQAAAKFGDNIVNKPSMTGSYLVVNLATGATSMVPLPFSGTIQQGVSNNVNIMGKPAATVGSIALGTAPLIPPLGTNFVKPPSNDATVSVGSATVKINNKPAARMMDTALVCSDPSPLPVGQVMVAGLSTVNIGG